MTYHFYNNLKLIQTVNNNFNHIAELEELETLFNITATESNDSNRIEYIILLEICSHTRLNHYSDKHIEWDVETILSKLEGKTREEIEAIDIASIIPNSED